MQLNSKRKQTDLPDSEGELNTIDETNNQDMVMEDQEISNPTQTRTSTRTLTPVTRDNKKRVSYLLKRPCLDWERHDKKSENEVSKINNSKSHKTKKITHIKK